MRIGTLIKTALTPGSIAFLVVCLLVWLGFKYVWPKTRRLPRIWLVGVVGLYFVLGLPYVANGIAIRLPTVPPVDLSSGSAVDALVVFDGDNRVGRVQETLRVYRAAPAGTVIVLGEAWIVDRLVAAGLPKERLSQVPGPPTTAAQMGWVEQRLVARPRDRTVLIASRLQMPRVQALTRSIGLALILIPSPIDDEPPTSGWRVFVPSYIALRVSRDALYEHAALAYYRWRGWI